MGIALILVIVSLALIAWRIRAKARARSVGRRSVSQRGTHRRSPDSLPLRSPTPPAPGRRPVKTASGAGQSSSQAVASTQNCAADTCSADCTEPPVGAASGPWVADVTGSSRGSAGTSRATRPGASARLTGQAAPSRGRHYAGLHMDGYATWVPAGQLVRVGECSISGGLIYVGRGLAAETGGGPDPALIDPGLDVDHRAPDYAGA